MSDSEQQQIVPSLIDHQTDKSDLTDPETIEADPAVQQTIESDIIDNNSSNDTDDSGNESPQQQQQQQGPIIQDLGPEDEIHEEQGPGQEYQVEEQGVGPAVVQQPSQQAIQQLTAAQGRQAGNVIEYHVHYYGAPVYQGSVIKGDIVGTKAQAKGATIGSIGGSQPSAIGGPEGQAALAWLGEGASGSSQVPAIGGPEQRPALPWHGEGERGALHPGNNQPLALPAPEAQSPSSGNEQLGEIGATVPTGEPEILDPIKPEKKSKKRPNRGGFNRDPESVPTSRSFVERRFIDEETLNANVTTPKVVGIPTASNPEISGAFPLIPPETLNRGDANVPSGARPKTTGIPTESNPKIPEAFPLIPPEPSNRRDVASGARPKTTGSQPPVIGGPGGQAALPRHGEGASGSYQVPAVGGPEQCPALPWHCEGASGSSQVPAVGGFEQRPALPWHCEGASGSSQVPAVGGPEQRPALPWHGEGEREGSNRDPEPVPTSRSSVERRFIGEETLNANVTTPKVVGIPTASNPEISGAFPLIPPEPSNRGDANVPSGASPKTTGIPTASNPEISEAFPLIPPEPSNRRNENVAPGARSKITDQQSRPTVGQIEPRKSLPHPEQIETRNSRDSQSALDPPVSSAIYEPLIPEPRASLSTNEQLQAAVAQVPANEQVLDVVKPKKRTSRKDRPSVRFSSQHGVEERSFVGEDTDVTIPKAIGSPTSPSPTYDRDVQQSLPSAGRTENLHRPGVNVQSGAKPKTTGSGIKTTPQPNPTSRSTFSRHPGNERLSLTDLRRSIDTSADMGARYSPELDETSEDETDAFESEENDSESEISNIIRNVIEYQKSVSKSKKNADRRKSRDQRSTIARQAPTLSRSRSTRSRHQRNERQFSSTNRVRSKSTDTRYSSRLDEASETADSEDSLQLIGPTTDIDSESELSSIIKGLMAYRRYKSGAKKARKIESREIEDRSTTDNPLTESQESQVSLVQGKEKMNPADQIQPANAEIAEDKRDMEDKLLQTDNCDTEYETSVFKMTEMYNKEQEIQVSRKLKSIIPLIEVVWKNILCQTTIKGCERLHETSGRLCSNIISILKNTNDDKTMKLYIPKIKDVMKLGEEFISSGKYIHAIVAFYAAAKLHRQSGKGIQSVKGIWTCFDRAGFVAEKMQKSMQTANVAKNHVIPIMHEMTDFLKPIHSSSQFAEELETKSKEFVKEKKFISATVTLYIAAKLHKETNEGNDSAHGVLSCIEQISLVMVEMIKQKQTKTLSHVISLITEMIDFIGMIEISNYSQFINEIIGKATEFDSEEKFIPSVVSFYVAAKLHGLNDNKGDQSVIGIYQSVEQIQPVVEKMTEQHSMKKIVKDHVIPLMRELLEIVQTIKGLSHKVRVEKEAWCLLRIGYCYVYCDEYQEDANINHSAIILIERELEEPQRYQIYGRCLNNAGVAYGRMGNIEKAVELYKMSLEAKMNAEDYSSDKAKNKSIEHTRNNLRINESKLTK
ncbi:uncharacterized protein LOC144411879 isoform X2 [Styela clava]